MSIPVEGAEGATRDPLEVAAYWHGVFEEGSEPAAPQYERFEAWLAADPQNRVAYDTIERSWAAMAGAGIDERILSMRRDALSAPQSRRPAHWIRATMIAASIISAILVIGFFLRHGPLGIGPNPGEFLTEIGQRSSIALSDGSTVMLDTASRIHVAFDDHARRVQLLAGQAWFEVAKGQARPFIVEAGNRKVIAHGTAFDVKLEDHDQVQVTLIEGSVSVEALSDTGAGPNFDLKPGDQLVITATGPAAKRKADLAKTISWREGQIIFDDDTLANAVTEVNRYSVKKIVLADPHLASLRMSGVFIAGHADSFLETVTGNFPIRVTSNAEGQILLIGTK